MSNLLIEELLKKHKGPRPADATTIYTVRWWLASDSFSGQAYMSSNQPTCTRLHNHKTFITKDKAEALKRDIDAAFLTLGYMVEGRCTIEEDWYE